MTYRPAHEIRVEAFAAVLRGDDDFQYREIMRWYSREFSTPLPQVEELDREDVLQHYWECHYVEAQEKDPEGFFRQGALLVRTDLEIERDERSVLMRGDVTMEADDYAAKVAAEEAARDSREALQAAEVVGKGLEAVVEALRAVGGDEDGLAGNLPPRKSK